MAKAENAEATNKTEKVAKATTKKQQKVQRQQKQKRLLKNSSKRKIRIRLKAYDNVVLDQSAEK